MPSSLIRYACSLATAGKQLWLPVFVSGIVFIIISVTGLRKMIINAIPQQLKLAIGAGIGFFIAFIGMKNAGIIVANESTFVALGNLTDPVVLLAVFGLALTLILIAKKVTAAVFWGLIGTAVVGVLAGLCGIANSRSCQARSCSLILKCRHWVPL